MTEPAEVQVTLDDNVLDQLAELICGGDGSPHYRRSREIEKFFRAAGWEVDECEGGRRNWTLDQLRERRDDPDALRAMLLRLADQREYIADEEAGEEVVRSLNQLLAVEGYQVTYERGRPQLVEQDPTLRRPAAKAPVELTASLANIVSDREFGQQLRSRLDEAHTCWSAGASTAAIIMLGSLLEGVLYDVALARHEGGKQPTDNLAKLIDLASEEGWIAKDVMDFAHTLRDYRNLVHPKKQRDNAFDPDEDTVRVSWNVVVAALNDLAELD